MRRCAKRDVIPADLQTYDPATWIQAAIDADDVLIRHIPVAERPTHWYVVRIIAPHSYRQALWASTGRRAGGPATTTFTKCSRLRAAPPRLSARTPDPVKAAPDLSLAHPGPEWAAKRRRAAYRPRRVAHWRAVRRPVPAPTTTGAHRAGPEARALPKTIESGRAVTAWLTVAVGTRGRRRPRQAIAARPLGAATNCPARSR